MKILLDECVTKKLKNYLIEYTVYTINEMGWNGVKNGNLMTLCNDNGFDILLTIDKNLMHQQNLNKYNVTIVVLNSFNSKIEEIRKLVPEFKNQIQTLEKRKAYIINL